MKFIFIIIILFLVSCDSEMDSLSSVTKMIVAEKKNEIILKTAYNQSPCKEGCETVWLGDSNSWYMDMGELFGEPICNAAIPGYTTYDILSTMNHYVSFKPKKIIIMIGTNNRMERLSSFIGSYEKIIDRSLATGANVYCISILYMSYDAWNNWRLKANKLISDLCIKKGITYINVDGITDTDLKDGVHMNAKGWDKFVPTVLQATEI